MANQWGRDSQVRTRGSSPAGPVLVAVACLLLGAGGSYGYLAMTRPDLRPQVETLTSQLDGVTKERDKLSKDIAAFRANSGSWAADLEKELAQLKLEEVPKLNRLLDTRDKQIETLQKERQTAKAETNQALETATKLRSEIDDLRSKELPKAAEDARQQALAEFADRETDAKAKADAALTAANAAADKARAEVQQELQSTNARAADLEKRLSSALKDAANAGDTAGLRGELEAANGKVTALQKEIETLTAEVKAARTAAASQANQPQQQQKTTDQTPIEQPDTGAPARVVRASAVVEDALDRTVGLQGLAATERQTLHDKLVAGECVVQSLDAVFDRVPVLVLRNLMRDLRSDC